MGATTDLLVIGAGPAGAAAAITAADAGRRVVVVDRSTFPRDKTCGDGLTTGALRWLEALGVPLDALGASAAVRDVVLVAPSGRHITLPLPRADERARVMRRADLDAALVARADRAGAELRLGGGVTALRSRTRLASRRRWPTARWSPRRFAVAADGHYSTGAPPPHARRPAGARRVVGLPPVLHRRRRPEAVGPLRTGPPPGYAWVFPLPDGRANVGFGMLRGPGITGKLLATTWRDLLARPVVRDILGPRAEPESPHRAWPIPSHLEPARLAHGRVLFAGDAAGVVDAMTGEGIAQALETGVLAARAALGDDAPEATAARYRADVDRALGRDLRFASRLQRVLAHPRGAELALRTVDLSPWTRRNFARWMFEDYPRAILFTPDRWHRGMLTPSGAYRSLNR